jgi:hypothetical protein
VSDPFQTSRYLNRSEVLERLKGLSFVTEIMMRSTGLFLTLLTAVSLLTVNAQAGGLIGTQVTGSAELNFIPENIFDPANGLVPAGYLNDAGTTVTISGTAIEFGAQNSTNLFTADFTANQLIITDVASAPFGGTSFFMSFNDSALAGLSLTTVSDTFPNGVLPLLSGSTVSVVYTGTVVNADTSFQAVFNLGPVVPEPASWILLSIAAAGLAGTMMTLRGRKDVAIGK